MLASLRRARNLSTTAFDGFRTTSGLNRVVSNPTEDETITVCASDGGIAIVSVDRIVAYTTKDARDLLRRINEKVDPLFAQVDQTLKDSQGLIRNVGRTSDDARKLINNVNSRIEPVQADWTATTKDLREALNAAEGALESIDGMVDENSEFRYQVDAFLSEITLMARSLRAFADYLERNPDALLRGKLRRAGQK